MATNLCTKCGQEKPACDFGKNCRRSDGLQLRCRDCANATKRAYIASHPEYKEKQRKLSKETGRRWYAKNAERLKKRYQDNKNRGPAEECVTTKICVKCRQERPACDFPKTYKSRDHFDSRCRDCVNAVKRACYANSSESKKRNSRLRNNYGISLADYDAMLAAQGGKCAICRRKRNLHVDHCHDTGKIRGLLCSPCNLGLGCFGDSPRILQAATKYRASHSKGRQLKLANLA